MNPKTKTESLPMTQFEKDFKLGAGKAMLNNGHDPIKAMQTAFGGSGPNFGRTKRQKQENTIRVCISLHEDEHPEFDGNDTDRFVDFVLTKIKDGRPVGINTYNERCYDDEGQYEAYETEEELLHVWIDHHVDFALGWAGNTEHLYFSPTMDNTKHIYNGLVSHRDMNLPEFRRLPPLYRGANLEHAIRMGWRIYEEE